MSKLLIWAIICLVSVLISANPISHRVSSIQKAEPGKYRLPKNTHPINYNVHLYTQVDEEIFDFNGTVIITFETTEETNFVTIHKRQLTIKEEKSLKCGEEDVEDFKETFDEETEHLTYTWEKKYPANTKCVLTLEYEGVLRTDNGGFYRSSYKDHEGNTKWLATTQFESTDARHAFPCYDEPGIRATFDIKITYGGENYHAISNMGAVGETTEDEDGTKTTTFRTTPLVQPYLIAFVVSDFDFVERSGGDFVKQRLFARPEAIANGEGEYGVDTGVQILSEQAKYFGVDYSLDKMDQISIPDFQAGAMENWGLVTYREELLLYNKTVHALNTKRRIAGIIAHEFAHQWFGNLVAPEWWSYLWLNEGFANMYQYYTVSTLYKEFDEIGFYIFENVQNALESDALETTRPMTHYVEEPIAIRNLFDDIAYDKSGSVLRMIQHALTDDVFKAGLKAYLQEKSHKAATPKDLAAGLQTAATGVAHIPEEITMEKLIDSWSLKAGYPLVTVERSDDNKITCTQSKFSYKVVPDADEENWIIPINMATASSPSFDDTKPLVWLTEKSHTIDPEPETRAWTTDDWIVLNIQETGFYRVNYDEKLWNQIVQKLKSDKFEDIHEFNRAQLVDDALNLARANINDYPSVFRLLEYMKKEQNFVPWASASSGLRYLQRQLLGAQSYDHFNRFVRELVAPLFAELGTEDQGEDEKLAVKHARTIAIDWACRTGDTKCIKETRDRVQEVIEDPSKEIEPDLRYIIYCNGLRQATEADYNAIIERLNNEQDQGERTILINALGCVQVSDIQKKFLQSSIADDSPVEYRIQERNRVLQGVYSNGQTGLENAIEFISENHKAIQDKYNPPSPVKNSVIAMSERVTSVELNTKFTALMETLTKEAYFTEEEKEKVLETPKENIAWTEANEGEIRKYFNDYYKDAATVPVVSTVILGMLLVISYLLQ